VSESELHVGESVAADESAEAGLPAANGETVAAGQLAANGESSAGLAAADQADPAADEAAPAANEADEAELAGDEGDPDADEAEPAADEAEPAADPVAEFTAELRLLPGDWYVVHSYAGYENRVRTNLESRTQSLNMEDYIFQIEVPVHEVTEIKGGKRQQVQEKVLPGYILVRMDLTDESWAAVRNTPGVTGFVGLSSRPSPLSLSEVAGLLAPEPEPGTKQAEAAKARKHKKSDRQSFGAARPYYPGGVMAGPLYNGQDYLGDDPDPNIRAYLLRDLSGRYGGGR
jgi:transcriptional antiterminator NusG